MIKKNGQVNSKKSEAGNNWKEMHRCPNCGKEFYSKPFFKVHIQHCKELRTGAQASTRIKSEIAENEK
jgi:hypothetical protein